MNLFDQLKPVVSGSYSELKNGVATSWSIRFIRTDAGRRESKRPRQKNDCTVRALATALELPYDRAYDELARAGRKCGSKFVFRRYADASESLVWHPFPAIKGEYRMNPAKFCALYPSGRWIVNVAKHVYAVVDGIVLDDAAPRPDRCVYGAWKVK